MRLSDILKKNTQQPQAQQPGAPAEASAPLQNPTSPSEVKPVAQETPPHIPKPPVSLKAEEVYTKAIIEIKNIISNIDKNTPFSSPIESVRLLVELIESGNEEIIVLADRATPDIFLYGHCVNLCIFSLFLGTGFNYPVEKLLPLGFCAFLNDLVQAYATKFQEAHLPLTRQQILLAQDIVNKLTELPENIKMLVTEVLIQKQSLKNPENESTLSADVSDFARIIAVADVYETLTHPRANKERILPHEALKTIIGSVNQGFDNDIIKSFLERISLYPPGSYVRLNSDEIGKVIGLNKGLPTRPKIKIIVDSSRQRVSESKIIDLAASPMIFIKEAVDETRLNLPDRKLSLELKASRWWVKGL